MSFPRIPLCTAVWTRLYPIHKKQKGKCPVRLIGKTLACLYTAYAALRHERLWKVDIRKRYDAQCSRRCQHPDKGSAMRSWLRLSFRRQ